jgi:hypothetical protein
MVPLVMLTFGALANDFHILRSHRSLCWINVCNSPHPSLGAVSPTSPTK